MKSISCIVTCKTRVIALSKKKKKIKYGWKGVTWIIRIDIKECFDRVNHEILLEKLSLHCD